MGCAREYNKTDKIRNEKIRSNLNIFSIRPTDNMEENKTQWKYCVDYEFQGMIAQVERRKIYYSNRLVLLMMLLC
jgi:hypothetical protein